MAVNIQLQQENNPQKQISRGQSVIPLITAAMPLSLLPFLSWFNFRVNASSWNAVYQCIFFG